MDSDVDVFSLVLLNVKNDSVYASANVAKRECSTSRLFTSCSFHATESRLTQLRMLITDLSEGEGRLYGCNVTSIKTGGRVTITFWTLMVTRNSK